MEKRVLSKAELIQRRVASRRPKGVRVAANSWKSGIYAKTLAGKIKPCKSTCSNYPCEMVRTRKTKPGDACLEKEFVVRSYRAILEAMRNKKYDNLSEVMAFIFAEVLGVINMLLLDINKDGATLRSLQTDNRDIKYYELRPHPSLLALPKLLADLGISFPEWLLTPRALSRADMEEQHPMTLAEYTSKLLHQVNLHYPIPQAQNGHIPTKKDEISSDYKNTEDC